MTESNDEPKPDLSKGVPATSLEDGRMLAGRVGEDDVVLVRSGDEVFAIGAHCTHYHGPLADGLVVGETVRCPWHHACFDLRTGEALHAPALSPVPCWHIERHDGKIFALGKRENAKPRRRPSAAGGLEIGRAHV